MDHKLYVGIGTLYVGVTPDVPVVEFHKQTSLAQM